MSVLPRKMRNFATPYCLNRLLADIIKKAHFRFIPLMWNLDTFTKLVGIMWEGRSSWFVFVYQRNTSKWGCQFSLFN